MHFEYCEVSSKQTLGIEDCELVFYYKWSNFVVAYYCILLQRELVYIASHMPEISLVLSKYLELYHVALRIHLHYFIATVMHSIFPR